MESPVPSVLCDVVALAADASGGAAVRWKLAESGRQLDANVVHLTAGQRVDAHREPDLDVLLLVLSGDGTLESAGRDEALTAGGLVWLPHGSTRALVAGAGGLSYLTVHRRRPGMQIGTRPPGAAGPEAG
ncbi:MULTISPECIES: hypothetical protein [Streptomyces]|uniref:AraC-type arabinose-binding/dimerisation domain-containing protein n=1 Tax=Streptomyces ramulosus TaxID=47762 RepID=A0ABW1FBV4_9ACTN